MTATMTKAATAAVTIDIGHQVRLFAPMLDEHGLTGTIVNLHRNADGDPVTAQVQLDANGEKRWLHHSSLRPIQEASYAV